MLYVVRHGETQWNAENRIQGRVDIPLSKLGREQCLYLKDRFEGVSLDMIISSPLSRALDTAKAIAESKSLDIQTDERLLEVDCGQFEGKNYKDLGEDQHWVKLWRTDPHKKMKGGESRSELDQRVAGFMESWVEQSAEEDTLIVAHGGVNKSILRFLMGVDLATIWRFYQANACVNIFQPHPLGFMCKAWNDTSHLPAHLNGSG